MKKILTIIGARPQFIKASIVSRALKKANFNEVIVHTGQHYDDDMSKIFFDELDMSKPRYNLNIGSGQPSWQIGQTLIALDSIILSEKPDLTLVYGDTNATLAGALASVKSNTPIAHIEAGLRSFDKTMPEEINRVFTDHCSKYLFCPSQHSKKHLENENIKEEIYVTGDVMYDTYLCHQALIQNNSATLKKFELTQDNYGMVTIHRNFNTDSYARLSNIVKGLSTANIMLVLPAHPRLLKQLKNLNLLATIKNSEKIKIIEPVGYLDMQRLLFGSKFLVTDSGGLQKEAYFHKKLCLTIRDHTEWVETIESGWNQLVPTDHNAIRSALHDISSHKPQHSHMPLYGDGSASAKIASILKERIN